MHDIVDDIVDIVSTAGGEIVGRTKLQKIAYVLEAANCGYGMTFTYYHYGPFCEELSDGVRNAVALSKIVEESKKTSWGGTYSVFRSAAAINSTDVVRKRLVNEMKNANSVELELAATALFLFNEGNESPWAKTALLKPEKATEDRLSGAKALFEIIRSASDGRLPDVR